MPKSKRPILSTVAAVKAFVKVRRPRYQFSDVTYVNDVGTLFDAYCGNTSYSLAFLREIPRLAVS